MVAVPTDPALSKYVSSVEVGCPALTLTSETLKSEVVVLVLLTNKEIDDSVPDLVGVKV
jgi:hypothetical protein